MFGSGNQIIRVAELELTGITGEILLRPVHQFLHLINTHSLGMIPGATIRLVPILNGFEDVLDGGRSSRITHHSPSHLV